MGTRGESTIIHFNIPADALESLGVALPHSLLVNRHVDTARSLATLQSCRGAARFVLWTGPGAEAERAATELVDVLARWGGIRPVLLVIDGWVAEPGSAIAEIAALQWTRQLDCALPRPERVLALRTFLAEGGPREGALAGLQNTLARLWVAALNCYRHDRRNAIRRLLQLGCGDPATLKRYLAEHGPTLLEKTGTLDGAFFDAARWYLPWNEGGRTRIQGELTQQAELFSRLVRKQDPEAFRPFQKGEEGLRGLLVAEWPRLAAEESP